jgi:hypothetical protein
MMSRRRGLRLRLRSASSSRLCVLVRRSSARGKRHYEPRRGDTAQHWQEPKVESRVRRSVMATSYDFVCFFIWSDFDLWWPQALNFVL